MPIEGTVQRTGVALGAGLYEVVIGEPGNDGFWLSVGNDQVAGTVTGPAVTATVYGHHGRDDLIVPYGITSFLTKFVRGHKIEFSGNGAFMDMIASDRKVNVNPQTIQSTNLYGSPKVASSVPITGATPTKLLTVPAGVRYRLLTFEFTNPNPGDTITLRIVRSGAGGIDYIANAIVAAGVVWTAGVGPGNDKELQEDTALLAGDQLWCANNTEGCNVNYSLEAQPV